MLNLPHSTSPLLRLCPSLSSPSLHTGFTCTYSHTTHLYCFVTLSYLLITAHCIPPCHAITLLLISLTIDLCLTYLSLLLVYHLLFCPVIFCLITFPLLISVTDFLCWLSVSIAWLYLYYWVSIHFTYHLYGLSLCVYHLYILFVNVILNSLTFTYLFLTSTGSDLYLAYPILTYFFNFIH